MTLWDRWHSADPAAGAIPQLERHAGASRAIRQSPNGAVPARALLFVEGSSSPNSYGIRREPGTTERPLAPSASEETLRARARKRATAVASRARGGKALSMQCAAVRDVRATRFAQLLSADASPLRR